MLPFVLRPPVLPVTMSEASDEEHEHGHVAAVVAPTAAAGPLKATAAPSSSPPLPPARAPASSIANPAPLGLLAFGVTTCLLMFRAAGWAEAPHVGLVICFAFFLGGTMQVLAGVCDLLRGDAFGGTAFSLYGAFWLGWGLLQVLSTAAGPQTLEPASAFKVGETLFLALFALLTALLFVPTMRKSLGLMYVFASLALTFALLAGGVWSAACGLAAGYVGFFCGVGAITVAFATLYKETLGWEPRLIRPVRLI
jgi:succinate-acetate transporter protein